MAEIASLHSQRSNRASPGELLKMLRNRSGLTQAQLAELLNLKSARMVRNWEGEFNLPTADRLRLLITLYLERHVFVGGKEREEVRNLWHIVKDWFETHNFNDETYPIFDEGWFVSLFSKPQAPLPADISLFQDFRPVEGLYETPPYTLPEPIRLLGREQELARLAELLAQSGKKLLTMTGAGGSGKTSLALALGNALLASFPAGVYFVELENVTTRESLVAEIARTLSLKEKPGQGLWQNLKDFLKEKHLLLILDNFEQLVVEAGVLAELLKASSRLNLLITSRIPLQLSVEREYPVGPLSLPAKGVVAGYEPGELGTAFPAVALFVERAQAVKPDFVMTRDNAPAVVEICRKLDGLPLALELAAARVRAFPPQKLLERLSLKMLTGGGKDLPARQQTLRATIEWSYELLKDGEKRLFARLAIFAGGCILEAAEAVCNQQGDLAIEVFEGIESLLTKNLMKQWEGEDGQTRYGMLVTIREFGLDKLVESGEFESLKQIYAVYYLDRIREIEPMLLGGNLGAALREIDSEYDNYRTVLYQAIEENNPEAAVDLGSTLGRYCDERGYATEGLRNLEKVFTLPSFASATSAELRAKAFRRAAFSAGKLGNYADNLRYAEESLGLYRELGDKLGIGHGLRTVGSQAYLQGEYGKARPYCEESLAIFREFDYEFGIAMALNDLESIALSQGDVAAAYRYSIESLTQAKEQGYKELISYTLANMAFLAVFQGNYEEGSRLAEEAIANGKDSRMDPRLTRGFSLNFNGLIAIFHGKYLEANLCFEECLFIFREMGIIMWITDALDTLGNIASNQTE